MRRSTVLSTLAVIFFFMTSVFAQDFKLEVNIQARPTLPRIQTALISLMRPPRAAAFCWAIAII